MKKVLLGLVTVAMVSAVNAALIERTWSSQAVYAGPSFESPTIGYDGAGWQIDVALEGSDATLPSLAPAAGAIGGFGWSDGYGYGVAGFGFDAVEGSSVVMRIYNGATKGAATHYLDSAAIVLDDLDDGVPPTGPQLQVTFDFGGEFGPGEWQAIPEPATIGLMGIAGLGMYLARRKVRR